MSNSRKDYWNWLNKQPAKYKAKTTPELKELAKALDFMYEEKEKDLPPIAMAKENLKEILEEDTMYQSLKFPHHFQTADGQNDFMDAQDIRKVYRKIRAVRDEEYLGQMITVWRGTHWVQLKDCYQDL